MQKIETSKTLIASTLFCCVLTSTMPTLAADETVLKKNPTSIPHVIDHINKKLQTSDDCSDCEVFNSAAEPMETVGATQKPFLTQPMQCVAEICGDVSLFQSGTYSGPSPQSDEKLGPVRKAIHDFIAAKAEETKLLNIILKKQRSGQPALQNQLTANLTYAESMQAASESLVEIINQQKTAEIQEAEAKRALKEDFTSFGRLKPRFEKNLILLLKDRRLAASAFEQFGSAYKYRFAYPDLDFQSAVSMDLQTTKKILDQAPDDVKELVGKTGLNDKLEFLLDRAKVDRPYYDEIAGKNVQSVTDKIHWIVATRNQLGPNSRLAMDAATAAAKFEADLLKKSKIRKLPIETISPKTQAMTMNQLTDSMVNEFQKPISHVSEITATYWECLVAFDNSETSLPNEEDLNTFRRRLPQIRETFAENLKGRVSQHTHKTFADAITNAAIYLPPEKSAYLKEVESYFAEQARSIRKAVATYERNPLDAELALASTDSNGSASENLAEQCERLSFHPMRDNSAMELGAISVGSAAVKDSNGTILAHEMSHILRHLLKKGGEKISHESQGLFANAEKCLIRNHKPFFDGLEAYNKGRSKNHRDDRKPNFYLVEDFADMLGAILSPKTNVACAIGGFIDMSLYDKPKPKLDSDPHATIAFRLMNAEMSRSGVLPASCQRHAKSQNYDIKKCL